MKSLSFLLSLLLTFFFSGLTHGQTTSYWYDMNDENSYSAAYLGLNIQYFQNFDQQDVETPLFIDGLYQTGTSVVLDLPTIRLNTYRFDDEDEIVTQGDHKFDIQGGMSLDFLYQFNDLPGGPIFRVQNNGNISLFGKVSSGIGPGSFEFSTDGDFHLSSGNSNSTFSILDNGEFHFGTDEFQPAPSLVAIYGDLKTSGKIYANEMEVLDPVPMPDYVFEETYDLKSLEEVESYIKKNKHLPGIPSAQDFKENGYNLSDMDRMLLEKIEELTLHVIRLEQQIAASK